MRLSLAVASAGLALLACQTRRDVPCEQGADCNLSGGGICLAASTGNHGCAYPDPDGTSGYWYSGEDAEFGSATLRSLRPGPKGFVVGVPSL